MAMATIENQCHPPRLTKMTARSQKTITAHSRQLAKTINKHEGLEVELFDHAVAAVGRLLHRFDATPNALMITSAMVVSF
jgi:hypothetical protein